MTAINIISVGVNCPELTPPKASWQTDGRRGDLQPPPPPSWDVYCTHVISRPPKGSKMAFSAHLKVDFPDVHLPSGDRPSSIFPFNFPGNIVELT